MDHGHVWLRSSGSGWRLEGDDPPLLVEANEYLQYLADRNYSPRTIRTYGYGLQAFFRWLVAVELTVFIVNTQDVLAFLTACRQGRGAQGDTESPVATPGQRVSQPSSASGTDQDVTATPPLVSVKSIARPWMGTH